MVNGRLDFAAILLNLIKQDIKNGDYKIEKVIERDKDPLRRKRIKSLEKQIKKKKQESTRDRMLLHFELGKELGEEYIKGGNKKIR